MSAIDFGLLLAVDQFLVSLGMKVKQTRLHSRLRLAAYLHPSACLVIYVRRYSFHNCSKEVSRSSSCLYLSKLTDRNGSAGDVEGVVRPEHLQSFASRLGLNL